VRARSIAFAFERAGTGANNARFLPINSGNGTAHARGTLGTLGRSEIVT
jgi:hypothetical protein